MTPAERKLWAYLRKGQLRNVKFRRQHAVGPYVADFCAPEARLIIELDGSQHIQQEQHDAERSAFLNSQGYRVIRFRNNEVMNDMNGVLAAIIVVLPKGKAAREK